MEPLAFVEVLDRHRDVIARHPVYRWPARIGRGYRSDVILDDPFVAPEHAVIEPDGAERFAVRDLGTVNGLVAAGSRERVETAVAGPDDILKLGHTQIRIRTPSYAVPPERALTSAALYRRPLSFVLLAGLAAAIVLWNGWIMTSSEHDKYWMVFALLALVAVVGTWISIWAFAGHATARRPSFIAHGSIACAGVVALSASEALFDYLSFAFDAGWLAYVAGLASAAIFAYVLYRHLVLNSRARRRALAYMSAGVSLALSGAVAAMGYASDLAQEGGQRYNDVIKTPALLWVRGVPAEAFLDDATKLKDRVDAMRTAD